MLTVIILTKNEERHIARAIGSVRSLEAQVLVVDSGSVDDTPAIAARCGAQVVSHPWKNYATQINWALTRLPDGTDWVLRLDADEIVSPALAAEIRRRLPEVPPDISGFTVGRRMTFLGGPVRFGGLFPIRVLRLFRAGKGQCENRWMDEHIRVDGAVADMDGEILDDNLNSLTWWTEKHNAYASREVVDILNHEFGFFPRDTVAQVRGGGEAGFKRWLKEKVYARLPSGLRAMLYFLYRFVFRLGFLDGPEGRSFHILQGVWYRDLVDAKLREVRTYMRTRSVSAPQAIREVLGIDVDPEK
jgi:glycosyltransferase involved in cell wall biosynthesis